MSQTEVRTFQAASMQAALDVVRRELGSEAVILHTRELPRPRFWQFRRSDARVEVTAGTGVNVRMPRVVVPPPAPPVSRASRPEPVAAPRVARSQPPLETSAPHFQSRSERDRELAPPPELLAAGRPQSRPRSEAYPNNDVYSGYAATAAPRPAPTPARPQPRPDVRQQAAAPADMETFEAEAFPTEVLPRKSFPRESFARETPARETPASERFASERPSAPARLAMSPGQQDETQASIARQLSSIQKMVEQLSRKTSRGEEVPSELFQVYTDLIDAEIEEDLAREFICRLKQESTPERLANSAACRARLSEIVQSEIRCTTPIGVTPGKRRVVALVGPTGVGKTTTIAKLAANFRLRDGIRMGLVTVDTYRVAAVEQLRTYAEIIDLPMKVVTGPREMRKALDELSGMDLVLIDTAGRSPRDEVKIQELKNLLAEAQVDEVHLVQSLVSSPRTLEANAEKFAAAGTTAMILTKLDEAAGMGSILSVARRIPLPISYVTTGQDVPDDIEHAETRRMSRLILGEERLSARRKVA